MSTEEKIKKSSIAIEAEPSNGELWFQRGLLYYEARQFELALADYNKALELNYNTTAVYNSRANALFFLHRHEEAIADYNKALAIDPQYVNAYNNRGRVFFRQHKLEEALKDFDKADSLLKNNAVIHGNRGEVLMEQEKMDAAIKEFDKAIQYAEKDEIKATAYYRRGKAHKKTEDSAKVEMALEDFTQALAFASKKTQAPLCADIKSQIKELEALTSKAQTNLQCIDSLMIDEVMQDIRERMKENERSYNQFIEEHYEKKELDVPRFHILRRWNSYTPIIARNHAASKGGGYFIETAGGGTVIDPGFNFIENFQAAEFCFQDIDHVFITHAHNDHTTDLESILTLLHKYNERVRGSLEESSENTILDEIKKDSPALTSEELEERTEEAFQNSPRHKRIDIYMTASTFKKYANFLDLHQSQDYNIKLISPCSDTIDLGDVQVRVLPAKHNDILSDRDSVGFQFSFKDYPDFVLVYTGDTGFDKAIEAHYTGLTEELKGKKVVLLAHIGGFKSYEDNYKVENFNDGKAFYKNHLGRLGLARLVEIMTPHICIISEFGEEFGESRIKLAKLYQKVYPKTMFFPGDIGFCINANGALRAVAKIPNQKPPDHLDYEYVDPSEVVSVQIVESLSLRYVKRGLDRNTFVQLVAKNENL